MGVDTRGRPQGRCRKAWRGRSSFAQRDKRCTQRGIPKRTLYLTNIAFRQLVKGFPDIPLPTKAALRNSGDGWGFLDLGDSAIHILSKDAKKKWFSRDQPGSSPERTFTRWY